MAFHFRPDALSFSRHARRAARTRRVGRPDRHIFSPVIEPMEDRALLTTLSLSVSSTAESGTGSLQAAILAANAWTDPGGSVITFAASISQQTINLASTLVLSESPGPEKIDGSGESITVAIGAGESRDFQVQSGVTATITGLTISGYAIPGSAPNSGGIYNSGTLTLTGCDITSNSAVGGGGGIYNDSAGSLKIVSSAIASNTAGTGGAGIENHGTAWVITSTIDYNGYSETAGGVDNWGNLTCVNATFAYNFTGGLYDEMGSTTTLDNTIIAANMYQNADTALASNDDIGGVPVCPASADNLIGVGGPGGLINGNNGNLVGVADPGLSYTTVNGVLGLVSGSPAIDAGSKALAVDPTTGQPLAADQRGVAYPQNNVDIGAFESTSPGTPTYYTVNRTCETGTSSGTDANTGSPSGDLLWAVTQANANTNPAGSVIDFDPTVFNSSSPKTICLTSTLNLNEAFGPEVIQGPGMNALTISGDNNVGVFQVAPVNDFQGSGNNSVVDVRISCLTISQGQGLSTDGYGTVYGGVYNADGRLTVTDCDITNNSTDGILNYGWLTISNSTISGDERGIDDRAFMAANNCLFTGNNVTGIQILNMATMNDCTISGNSSDEDGLAAVFVDEGGLIISNSTIDNNSSGGFALWQGSLIVNNCTITLNSAVFGAGIGVVGGDLTVTDSTIADNSSTSPPTMGEEGPGGGVYDQGSLGNGEPAPALLENTIVVDNTDPNGADDLSGPGTSGPSFSSQSSNNLIGNDETGLLDPAKNLLNVTSPGLGSLASNGGTTQTIALLAGSPAIDAGNSSLAVDPTTLDPLTYDQRGPGYLRVVGSAVDIGAFEYQSSSLSAGNLQSAISSQPSSVPVVLQTASSAALSTALGAVSGVSSGTSATINLDLGSATVTPSVPISVPADVQVTLSGSGGAVISGVTVSSGTVIVQAGVTPSDWTVNGGNVTVLGTATAGDFIVNGGTVTLADGTVITGNSPALIVNGGTVILQGVTAQTATASPTILVNGGTLIVRDSTIQESTTSAQAAISIIGGTVDLGTATSPGGNLINVNGTGELIYNASGTPISAIGDTFTINGVTVVPTTTSVRSSVSPTVFGQAVTFTATVAPTFGGTGTPTGTVTFYDGSTAIGTRTLSGGSASLTTSTLAVGGHLITAVYGGDSTFDATGADLNSTAGPFSETVNPASTFTAISSSSNPWVQGQPVTFTAIVAVVSPGGGVPQGSVVFKNGSTVLGTVPLAVVNGSDQAVLTSSSLPVGTDTVTATYVNSDGNDLGSSGSLSQTILGPGVYAVGTQLLIVGANTSDYAQVSPTGSKSDGTTGLQVNSTLNNVWSSKTFNQTFTAIYVFGYGGNDDFQLSGSLTLPTTVVEGNGNDYLQLAGGNDVVTLGTGSNQVFGGNGNKTITDQDVAGTNAYLSLGLGNETITLGAGNDQVVMGGGTNVVTAGNGNDSVTAGNGTNAIALGNGNNYVQAGNGTDSVTMGSGNDDVQLGGGANTVTLGNGNDYVSAGSGNNTVTVGNGNDTTQLGNGDNVVVEGNGNDYVSAGNGANLVVGGLGQHTIQLGNGSNILIDGSVTLTQSGDSLRAILTAWKGGASAASLRSRLAVTYNVSHPNYLSAGSGRDWFFYTSPNTNSNKKSGDSLN
jgi:Bacterial Ig-like domain (group 3)/Right handed beta helix region/RTX calcium-binding nonapeptide repeat (4 copies)